MSNTPTMSNTLTRITSKPITFHIMKEPRLEEIIAIKEEMAPEMALEATF